MPRPPSSWVSRVLGPNGAGKTSLLLAIAGRLPAAQEAILFGGAPPPRGSAARARRGLARTFQSPKPFSDWTVGQNVAIAAERAGVLGDVDRLLEDFELKALEGRPGRPVERGRGKAPGARSGARVQTGGPSPRRPLAGLTPQVAKRISGLIEGARRQGAAVVWVEHGPVAGEQANQLLVLEGGETRFLGLSPRLRVGRSRRDVVMARLEARGLTGGYPGVRVFSGVAFSIESGELLTILGANGSGKSTLLETLQGRAEVAPSFSMASRCKTLHRKPGPLEE